MFWVIAPKYIKLDFEFKKNGEYLKKNSHVLHKCMDPQYIYANGHCAAYPQMHKSERSSHKIQQQKQHINSDGFNLLQICSDHIM